MIVCVCNTINDRQIRQAAEDGACSLQDLQKQLPVATCCGKCEDCARKILHQHAAENYFIHARQGLSLSAAELA